MPVPGKQMTPMHFWISLSPMAPLFGVEWRFARMFPAAAWFNPVDTLGKMAAASAAESQKAAEEAARKTVAAQKEAAAAMADAAAKAVQAAMPLKTEAADSSVAETIDIAPVAVPADDAPSVPEAPVTAPPAVLFDVAPLDADDLKQLKGVGPKLEEMLNAMGIYRFEQIAGFSDANIAWVDQNLTAFKGRPFRDDWVAQAKALL